MVDTFRQMVGPTPLIPCLSPHPAAPCRPLPPAPGTLTLCRQSNLQQNQVMCVGTWYPPPPPPCTHETNWVSRANITVNAINTPVPVDLITLRGSSRLGGVWTQSCRSRLWGMDAVMSASLLSWSWSGAFTYTPCRHLRPSSGREHTVV